MSDRVSPTRISPRTKSTLVLNSDIEELEADLGIIEQPPEITFTPFPG